jgi:hypothetical protein
MGISESHQQFVFKVEPKPGGGYVSTSDNPALVFEGTTEEEVQQRALEKIGELGGPEIAAAIKDLQKPGAGVIAGEKRFSISVNKRTTFSLGKKQPVRIDGPSAQLASAESDPFAKSSQGGLNSTVKLLIVIAVLILVFLLISRR